MIGDPQRLQYLEAMGIPAWVSRYRFVNAKPTETVEWQITEPLERRAPGARLHALLDASNPAQARESDTPAATSSASSVTSRFDRPQTSDQHVGHAPEHETPLPVARARAILGIDDAAKTPPVTAETQAQHPPAVAEMPTAEPDAAAQVAPLRFTLSLGVIGERWWLVLPGDSALSDAERKLLGQLLSAAKLPTHWSLLATLAWPLMEAPSSDPVGEARDGIRGFCAGQALRNDLTIEGAIVVGDNAAWGELLADEAEIFDVACQRWPHPQELLGNAAAKRACWPRLAATFEAWCQHGGRSDAGGSTPVE